MGYMILQGKLYGDNEICMGLTDRWGFDRWKGCLCGGGRAFWG